MSVKVLFLDDEEMICECFFDQYSDQETEVYTYLNSNEAISASFQKNPDVIFLDYRMPGTSGDTVAAKMPPSIPKYLISGELEAKPEYEFIDIIAKPFDINRVAQIINKYRK